MWAGSWENRRPRPAGSLCAIELTSRDDLPDNGRLSTECRFGALFRSPGLISLPTIMCLPSGAHSPIDNELRAAAQGVSAMAGFVPVAEEGQDCRYTSVDLGFLGEPELGEDLAAEGSPAERSAQWPRWRRFQP